MTPAPAENDPTRRKILAAIDRLLAGKPLRSTGRLSVSQLAIEAGVGRWNLTHQHLDLKEQFQAYALAARRAAQPNERTDVEKLRTAHAELRAHCAEVEERLELYANVINLLMAEKEAANTVPVAHLETSRRRRAERNLIGPC